ncbi:hypothetical protein [Enterobacillus tribolii]|uniref:Oligosaccharide repeat unit polymerase n=1 Tax=Enterobacillus tribolii TaxID=1487935 RepID=A0A370R2M0_9GAMM|nr:hypothetical protein [Enterobacillus tribolii]MBW7984695.1 hypothetical protein [Enterobacillus tribolii]RDK96692.1 hypothetical protein C8D90_101123 [Enterobacillus tribolii]
MLYIFMLFFIFALVLIYKRSTGTYINQSIFILIWWLPVYLNSIYYGIEKDNNTIAISLSLSIMSFLIGFCVFAFQIKTKRINGSFDSYNGYYRFLEKKTISFLFLSMLTGISLFYLIYGTPLLSSNPDLAKIAFGEQHGIFLRFIKYMLPLLLLSFILLEQRKFRLYFYITLCLIFVALVGHKGLAMTFMIVFIIFVKINHVKIEINYKLLLVFVAIWVAVLIHILVGEQFGSFTSYIVFRFAHIDGLQIIYEDIVPRHGLYWGTTIMNEMSGTLGKLGLYEGSAETTGMFVARYYYNNPDYMFEIVSPGAAHLYLNFGTLGVILGSLLLGLLNGYLLLKMYSTRSSIRRSFFYLLSMLPVLCFSLGKIGSTIISDMLSYIMYFIILVIFYHIIKYSSTAKFISGKV